MCNKWISVEDRLPEKDRVVLAYIDGNRIYFGEFFEEENEWFLRDHGWLDYVTHWMDLPDVPSKADSR